MPTQDELLRIAHGALSAAGADAQESGHGRWRLALPVEPAMVLSVQVRDKWLQFAGLLPAVEAIAWRDLVAASGEDAGCAKVAGLPEGRLHLRAEIPIDPTRDALPNVASTLQGFVGILGQCGNSAGVAAPVDGPDWGLLMSEAGWPGVEKSEGVWMVEIPDRAGVKLPVNLRTERNGAAVARLTLLRRQMLAPVCQDAIGKLLVRANALVRFAKGELSCEDGTVTAGFAAALGHQPSAADLDHALCALTAACQKCAEELRILEDEAAADRYLRPPARVNSRGDDVRTGDQQIWADQPLLQ